MAETKEGKRIYEKMEEEEEIEEEEEEIEDDEGGLGFVENDRKKKAMFTSSISSKKGPPASYCQADNCNADLKAAKRYYKRHKVCEFHAKAAMASVAGDQQRFCQQCSRFHILSEFDNSKRSCRSRLAGHNERRRKNLSEIHGDSST